MDSAQKIWTTGDVDWNGLEQEFASSSLDAVPVNARQWEKFKQETQWWTQTRKKMVENQKFFIKGLNEAPFDFKKSPRELMKDIFDTVHILDRNGYSFDDLVWVRDESVKRYFTEMFTECTAEAQNGTVYYRNADEVLFQHDKKDKIFWILYDDVLSVFILNFCLKYNQIKELIKCALDECLKLEHSPAVVHFFRSNEI